MKKLYIYRSSSPFGSDDYLLVSTRKLTLAKDNITCKCPQGPYSTWKHGFVSEVCNALKLKRSQLPKLNKIAIIEIDNLLLKDFLKNR